MSEMKKVWLVFSEWHSGDSCPDNWYNNDTSGVEAVFSSEENAVNYVLFRLTDILKEDVECDGELFSMPSKDDVYLQHGFEWPDGWGGTSAFVITEYDVDRLFHDYKEDK